MDKTLIQVFKEALPETVRGISAFDESKERFYILINSTLSDEEQRNAFLHEALHIWNDDFQRKNVQEIEAFTHDFITRFTAGDFTSSDV